MSGALAPTLAFVPAPARFSAGGDASSAPERPADATSRNAGFGAVSNRVGTPQ